MKTLLKTLSFVFILTLLSSSLYAQQTTTVTRVVDGDTLKVFYSGGEESIRLIGIDTPESRVNKKTKRDRYKRLLGYVYLSNGNMLNEEIVKAGYASVMTIPPNVKYKDRFLKAYKQARERKIGLWK